MINLSYLDRLNDVEICSDLRKLLSFVINDFIERFYCKVFKTQIIYRSVFYYHQKINGRSFLPTCQKTVIRLKPSIHPLSSSCEMFQINAKSLAYSLL